MHEWLATPYNRITQGSNCPYCVGVLPISGETDLETLFPGTAAEWSGRNEIKASEVLPKSAKKVWWICKEGHEWLAVISNRTSGGTGCPECSGKKISAQEVKILCSFSRYGEVRYLHKIGIHEVDIYMPYQNLVIEYDGLRWHKDRVDSDTYKTQKLLDSGFRVIRIRQEGLVELPIQSEHYIERQVRWYELQTSLDQFVDSCFDSIECIQTRC